jgi:DNA polymerase I-like protein with 3'-5' exonuclease and polymerase domains
MNLSLFDDLPNEYAGDWRPEPPPPLDNIPELELDTETTGLKWWEKDRPIGIAIFLPDRRKYYLPWGHAGGNLPEEQVKRWAQQELRGKKITNLNMRFDAHMMREWGVDLDAQGNRLSDVGHHMAMLDDHRLKHSLESISQDILGRGKSGEDLDKTRMASYHAGQVAAYAENDVELVHDIRKFTEPLLKAEGLNKVWDLEDAIIPVVCEMEKNGAPLDLELLDRWVHEAEQEFLRILWEIWRETGIKFEPTTECWIKLFEKLDIPITEFTEKNNPSFQDDVLKNIAHPIVQKARRSARLKSLSSKYLTNYKKRVGSDGILRYALHQLRAVKDDVDEATAGTISGRFSSTEIMEEVGVNIQQVFKVAKQRTMFGIDEEDSSRDDEIYIVRQLFRPQVGQWLSADAMQIEYRLFANLVRSPSILEAYKQDPKASFHRLIESQLKPYKSDLSYRQVKDLNFMRIYGGGLTKLALMMGFITKYEFQELRKEHGVRIPRDHPKLEEALKIDQIYKNEIPETAELLQKASGIAASRGYVKTILGRRARFPEQKGLHKALNRVIQGGAADVMKQKLVELYRERKETNFTMRFTVHDEVDGDAQTSETKQKVQEVLDSQSFPELTVPILWEVNTGKSWKEAS